MPILKSILASRALAILCLPLFLLVWVYGVIRHSIGAQVARVLLGLPMSPQEFKRSLGETSAFVAFMFAMLWRP